MKVAILGTRGIPNNYGGFEQCAEYLSVGLVERGHDVTIYSPKFHPYKEDNYKGVKIIRKVSPKDIFGHSASNFIYDYFCLRDAVRKDFDIILELGLITSSLSIIFCRHRGKIIATNLDGLEWKRSKWNLTIQKITRTLEKYGVKFSDYLIADNIAIKDYIYKEYKRDAKYIPYGTLKIKTPNPSYLKQYNLEPDNYFLTIARLEPENNLEMMFDAYLKSAIKTPYCVVGHHLTKYGDFLKDKYRGTGIIFLGGIFNKDYLDNIRYYSKIYLHGHSVGGTNPALLEAMAAKTFIVAHNNQFNKTVVEENALYFKTVSQLSKILKDENILLKKECYIKKNLDKINRVYQWDIVIEAYEKYMLDILKSTKQQ